MIHSEVKTVNEALAPLINYLVALKVKNTTIYYALNRNVERMAKANTEFDKVAKNKFPELFEIEDKAVALAQPINEKIEKDNAKIAEKEKDLEVKTPAKPFLTIAEALGKLSKDDQDKHKALIVEYNKFLAEEDDVQIYTIKKEVLDSLEVELDFWAVRVLSQFIED